MLNNKVICFFNLIKFNIVLFCTSLNKYFIKHGIAYL